MSSPYVLKQLSFAADDYSMLVGLFRKEGGNLHVDHSFLEWQYEKNPVGCAVGFNAFWGDKLVAHYAAIPVTCVVNGVVTTGLLSINTRTDAEHQGKGLFSALAEATFTHAKERGFAFVVGVANDNSVHGFTRRLAFQHVATLETRLVLGINANQDVPDPAFYRVWDRETLAWRLSNPKNVYRCRDAGSNSLILGRSRNFDALVGRVSRGMPPDHYGRAGFSFNPLKLWVGLDSGIDWRHSCNIRVPQRFRSVTLNLIFRHLTEPVALDRESVRFWALDFDAY